MTAAAVPLPVSRVFQPILSRKIHHAILPVFARRSTR
jgi:hypothetical protein